MSGGGHRPFFLESSTTQTIVAWIGIVANCINVTFGVVWIWRHETLISLNYYALAVDILVGLFLADIFSGFVHWATDTWFDELSGGRVIAIAREHHLYPQHIVGYGFADYVAYSSWPTLLVFGPMSLGCAIFVGASPLSLNIVAVCTLVSFVMLFGTYAHRLGHQKVDSKLVILLQRANLLMSPQHHMVHHRDNHDIRYCVVNGWANIVCDRIGFWRFLEQVVYSVTGAVPRAHDHLCFSRFRNDRSFVTKVWWGYGPKLEKTSLSSTHEQRV